MKLRPLEEAPRHQKSTQTSAPALATVQERSGPNRLLIGGAAFLIVAAVGMAAILGTQGSNPGTGTGSLPEEAESPTPQTPTPVPATQLLIPSPGVVWFGETFDPETFSISGHTNSVGALDSFVWLAHLPGGVYEATELVVRTSWNGSLVATEAVNGTWSPGDLIGSTGGPLFEPGQWEFNMVAPGGNVLATGFVTVES
jgi:hypothetical protein